MKDHRETEVLRSNSGTDGNRDIPPVVDLSGKDIFKLVFAKIITFLLTATILVIFIVEAGAVAGYIHDSLHDIQNPVIRGDDLGGGLVVILWISIAFIISLASFRYLYKFVHSITKKMWGVK